MTAAEQSRRNVARPPYNCLHTRRRHMSFQRNFYHSANSRERRSFALCSHRNASFQPYTLRCSPRPHTSARRKTTLASSARRWHIAGKRCQSTVLRLAGRRPRSLPARSGKRSHPLRKRAESSPTKCIAQRAWARDSSWRRKFEDENVV